MFLYISLYVTEKLDTFVVLQMYDNWHWLRKKKEEKAKENQPTNNHDGWLVIIHDVHHEKSRYTSWSHGSGKKIEIQKLKPWRASHHDLWRPSWYPEPTISSIFIMLRSISWTVFLCYARLLGLSSVILVPLDI